MCVEERKAIEVRMVGGKMTYTWGFFLVQLSIIGYFDH